MGNYVWLGTDIVVVLAYHVERFGARIWVDVI